MQETPFVRFLKRAVRNRHAEKVVYAAVALCLLASLWLPPVSLGTRVLHLDYPAIAAAGGMVSTSDGAQLLIPQGALSRQLRLKMTALSSSSFLSGVGDKLEKAAAQAIASAAMTLQGDLYRFSAYGPSPKDAVLTLPLPTDIAPVDADLYAWDGQKWDWTSAHLVAQDNVLEAHLSAIPSLVAVMQTKRQNPALSSVLSASSTVPDEATSVLTEINSTGYVVAADGTISDVASSTRIAAPQGYLVIPVVSNRQDGKVQADVLSGLLGQPEARSKNATALAALAVEKMYTGVQLDYAGLDPNLSAEFVSFVQEVADVLHKQGKLLAVRVPTPRQIAEDRWDTGAYDWRALGEVADAVVVPAMTEAAAYAPGGQMEALLRWAVGEVERTKLQLALSLFSRKVVDNTASPISYLQALSEVAQVAVKDQKVMVAPGEDVTLLLPKLSEAGGLQYDKDSATYWLAYKDEQGQDCQVWLENASSVARKLQLVGDYGLRGVTLEDWVEDQSDGRVWEVVKNYRELVTPSADSNFTVVWTIEGPEGAQSGGGSAPLTSPDYVWHAPDQPGDYTIAAAISDDGGRTANVRSNSISLEIPTPTPTPLPTPTPTPKPTPKPAAAAPAASRGPGFDYGIQGDALTDSDHGRLFGNVLQIGFHWYKQQVEWFRYNPAPGQYDWAPLDRIADSAQAAGVKVLFSVVKAPQWARPAGDTDQGPPADPATYATFLREMAAHFKGRVQGYEIWNEQNLYYEWGGLGGKLNANKYVELLKAAYQAIKSVDSSATVISGALTPTGYNDGNIAIDDRVYLEQMYQAGLKNYCDAVGAHPSGYNNPPDATWQSFTDPTASFNAKGHPSWFFRGTLESYRNIMVKYGDSAKRIWVTEFGWASVENLGAAPAKGYEYAADNTEQEQAEYIVRAYQIAKGWGWVGPMFLWNLNFGPICGRQDEKSAFGIVRSDWSPRPAFAALANMPK